jgi:undecaprenyl-phosphate 4-deoxy-4-formamido-L-arabinose transferase
MKKIDLSVVIPVYNEEESLPELTARLWSVLTALGRPFEVVFVNDGSRDDSLSLLLAFREEHPEGVHILDFNGNFGQHMAVVAGLEQSCGEFVITLDADLQNPPEEIPRLLDALDRGYDVVGTIRESRRDPLYRTLASRIVNCVTNRITGLNLHDYGCMLRGYRRDVVDIINRSVETSTFIPALAKKFATNPIEISVAHNRRERGSSKYGLFRLIQLNFDLMTGFSLAPLRFVTVAGTAVALGSFLFALFMLIRRLWVGPEAEGVFTLLAINFFLMGVLMCCVGILGEYVGRIHQEVRRRPRFIIRRKWGP